MINGSIDKFMKQTARGFIRFKGSIVAHSTQRIITISVHLASLR